MTTIKAIETRYAGCRFRSRLEARWAVFFDALGIRWEYEPEGYMVGPVCEPGKPVVGYLPDFWLPDLHVWVEVKGRMNYETAQKLCWATCPHNGLPSEPGGDRPDNTCRYRILVLGDVPTVSRRHIPTHKVLGFWKGEVFADSYAFMLGATKWCLQEAHFSETAIWNDGSGFERLIPADDGQRYWTEIDNWSDLTVAGTTYVPHDHTVLASAYRAARSARFEHGESG